MVFRLLFLVRRPPSKPASGYRPETKWLIPGCVSLFGPRLFSRGGEESVVFLDGWGDFSLPPPSPAPPPSLPGGDARPVNMQQATGSGETAEIPEESVFNL